MPSEAKEPEPTSALEAELMADSEEPPLPDDSGTSFYTEEELAIMQRLHEDRNVDAGATESTNSIGDSSGCPQESSLPQENCEMAEEEEPHMIEAGDLFHGPPPRPHSIPPSTHCVELMDTDAANASPTDDRFYSLSAPESVCPVSMGAPSPSQQSVGAG